MKILSGNLKGLDVSAPPGLMVRPTLSKVRTAFLNSVQSHIEDSVILDIFSGSGIVGLELISRGARGGVFVENGRPTLKSLRNNMDLAKNRLISGGYEPDPFFIIDRDFRESFTLLEKVAKFDVIWADPPYSEAKEVLSILLKELPNISAPDALFAFESGCKKNESLELNNFADPGWDLLKEKKYGDTALAVFGRKK